MKKAIFIIHPSEIVRKGLHTLLRHYFYCEITQLPHHDSLADFIHMGNTVLLIIAPQPRPLQLDALKELEKNNELHWLVLDERKPQSDKKKSTNYLSLYSPAEEIREQVQELIQGKNFKPAPEHSNADLSVREREVLEKVALGLSNKEIAEQLFISVHTVISHRKNITEKLGIKSISGLTVYAILNKIVDPETIDPEELI